jgi:hypothetical protein
MYKDEKKLEDFKKVLVELENELKKLIKSEKICKGV